MLVHPSFQPCTFTSVCLAFVQDTTFSALQVTALFLRPIYKVLDLDPVHGGTTVASAEQKNLVKLKWLTLAGTSPAVVSSTALHVNVILFMALSGRGKPFYSNPYLNVSVFGINMDSTLNNLGMLLVCGVTKKISCVFPGIGTTGHHPVAVEPEDPPSRRTARAQCLAFNSFHSAAPGVQTPNTSGTSVSRVSHRCMLA